jgi:hypothetical protein
MQIADDQQALLGPIERAGGVGKKCNATHHDVIPVARDSARAGIQGSWIPGSPLRGAPE